jgi:glycogen debranching enzyme
MEAEGTFAVALDGEKRQVDSVTSNPGHCLWAGIVDEDLAPRVAASLVAPGLWSGWGIRTLESANAGYNPVSYHCGSVWPHDNALAIAGLARYGLYDQARRVASGLLDAATTQGGSLPELFCGLDRSDVELPVGYPTSCQPQAWAAAAPLLMLRSLLGFDPDSRNGVIRVRPRAVPGRWRPLAWRGVRVAGHRLDVMAEGDRIDVRGLPHDWGLDVVDAPA